MEREEWCEISRSSVGYLWRWPLIYDQTAETKKSDVAAWLGAFLFGFHNKEMSQLTGLLVILPILDIFLSVVLLPH